ncbi:MAG: reductase anchor subunit [Firmicutes bacterium]|nr:reductase anchor subunit [Bacillota bacterium]
MFSEEWPLMMFTLLSQLAVGTYIILLFIRFSLMKNDVDLSVRLTNPGLKVVGPIMALALVLSVFHLGTPLGAYRAVLNLTSSWLSREIIMAGGFFVFWFLSYSTFKQGKPGVALGIVTALFGFAAVFSNASVHAMSVRPAWMDVNTYLAFYGTTFAMGCVGATSLVAFELKGSAVPAPAGKILKTVAIIAGIAVAVPLVYTPFFVSTLNAGSSAAHDSAAMISGSYLMPLVIRAVLSLAGAVLLYSVMKKPQSILPVNQAFGALMLIAAGEFIGRYVFYATAVSIFTGRTLI